MEQTKAVQTKSPDRSKAPELKISEKIHLNNPIQVFSENGWPVYIFNEPTYEVTHIDIVFGCGIEASGNFLTATAMAYLLDSGTTNRSSFQIAEIFESHGAVFSAECHASSSVVSISSLTKHLKKLLPVISEIILTPNFPEDELEVYKARAAQRISVERNKVNYLARKAFNRLLFGSNSVFGFEEKPEDYKSLNREELSDFHKKEFLNSGMAVFIAGKADSGTVNEIMALLPRLNGFTAGIRKPLYQSSAERQLHIGKEETVQTAIRIGRPFYDRTHPDFIPFSILNSILGGYFGSRLMANIREDKGYTYGINSVLQNLPGVSSFFITTEVGKSVTDEAISEIYKELERLKEPVGEEELSLVQNYLYGNFQRAINGPIQLSKVYRNLFLSGLDFSFHKRYLHTLASIRPAELASLAKKYFNKDDFYQVTVG